MPDYSEDHRLDDEEHRRYVEQQLAELTRAAEGAGLNPVPALRRTEADPLGINPYAIEVRCACAECSGVLKSLAPLRLLFDMRRLWSIGTIPRVNMRGGGYSWSAKLLGDNSPPPTQPPQGRVVVPGEWDPRYIESKEWPPEMIGRGASATVGASRRDDSHFVASIDRPAADVIAEFLRVVRTTKYSKEHGRDGEYRGLVLRMVAELMIAATDTGLHVRPASGGPDADPSGLDPWSFEIRDPNRPGRVWKIGTNVPPYRQYYYLGWPQWIEKTVQAGNNARLPPSLGHIDRPAAEVIARFRAITSD